MPLHLDFVVLSRAGGERRRVPLAAFRSPALKLNRGYLQRALEHANDCHREDLGQVVVRTTGTPAEQLLDARLSDLTTHGAELSWIDREGGHRVSLWFSRPARSVEELGRAAAPGAARGHLLGRQGVRFTEVADGIWVGRYEWFDVNVTLVRRRVRAARRRHPRLCGRGPRRSSRTSAPSAPARWPRW